MSYYKESQARYKKGVLRFNIQWSKKDEDEGKRFLEHCEAVHMSKQDYIKMLIREDMERKGY